MRKIVVVGSSVALGSTGTGHQLAKTSWPQGLAADLGGTGTTAANATDGVAVVDVSEEGCDSADTIRRFGAVVPWDADVVIVALSLANEGLPYETLDLLMDGVVDRFLANLAHLALMIERRGAVPVIAGVYPFGRAGGGSRPGLGRAYTAPQHARLLRAHRTLMAWPSAPSSGYRHAIDFLSAVDDGTGLWRAEYAGNDAGHPNDAGHAAMARAVHVVELLAVAAPSAGSVPRRVLAFGDGLTAGVHSGGNRLSPWGAALGRLIGGGGGGGGGSGGDDARVDVNGACGAGAVELAAARGSANQCDSSRCIFDGLGVLLDWPPPPISPGHPNLHPHWHTRRHVQVPYGCVVVMIGSVDLGFDLAVPGAVDSSAAAARMVYRSALLAEKLARPMAPTSTIVHAIVTLHRTCHAKGNAVPIPPPIPCPSRHGSRLPLCACVCASCRFQCSTRM